MPYNLEWLEEKRILYVTYEQQLTGPEIEQLVAEFNAMVSAGRAPVHIIDDLRGLKKLPPKIRQLRRLTEGLRGDNVGWVVLIQDNMFAGFVANTFNQLSGIQMTQCDNVNDALAFLARRDATISKQQARTG